MRMNPENLKYSAQSKKIFNGLNFIDSEVAVFSINESN